MRTVRKFAPVVAASLLLSGCDLWSSTVGYISPADADDIALNVPLHQQVQSVSPDKPEHWWIEGAGDKAYRLIGDDGKPAIVLFDLVDQIREKDGTRVGGYYLTQFKEADDDRYYYLISKIRFSDGHPTRNEYFVPSCPRTPRQSDLNASVDCEITSRKQLLDWTRQAIASIRAAWIKPTSQQFLPEGEYRQ